MTIVLLLVMLALAIVLYVMTAADDVTAPRRCPSCGLLAVETAYRGHGQPLGERCTRCGHER